MPTYRDKGIVLRVRPLRDADRHYVVYTEAHGKVLLLAKGSRNGKSKLSPHLGSLGVVDLLVAKGKLVDRVAGASLARPHRGILLSLEKMASVQSFLLAVDALTKRDYPDAQVYELLEEYLAAVDAAEGAMDGRSTLFDSGIGKLMDLLGFGLELRACVRCRSPLVPEGNGLSVIRGGIECAKCRDASTSRISSDAIKALRFLREEPVAAVAYLRLPPHARREVALVTDLLLASHLEDRFAALKYIKALG